MSTTTPESFIKSFPKPLLTKIIGLPTYQTIKKVNDKLSQNAASVHTKLGGGAHGYLALTVNPTIYTTISTTPFVMPTNLTAPNTTGMIGPQISTANRTHDSEQRKFWEYSERPEKQLIEDVEDIYMEEISQPYIGFGNQTILNMLTHLYDIYAKILPADLIQNQDEMNVPWDLNQPFEFLIRQI